MEICRSEETKELMYRTRTFCKKLTIDLGEQMQQTSIIIFFPTDAERFE
jgi:hypothetical protein